MDFDRQHKLAIQMAALQRDIDKLSSIFWEKEQARAMGCSQSGNYGHDTWSCPLRREFSEPYNSEPMSRPYKDFYNPGPSYEPYNNSYNMDGRNNQDFSWSNNEVNTYEQPIPPYQPRKLSLEEKMNNLAQTTRDIEEIVNRFSQATIQSRLDMEASVERMEVHKENIAKAMQE